MKPKPSALDSLADAARQSHLGRDQPARLVAGLLLVDKPRGLTSHDVVGLARRALGSRRVGHAGTLDPMATGLLPILVGEATKLAPYVVGRPKEYEGTLELGSETDTLDAEGSVTRSEPLPDGLSATRIEQAWRPLVGGYAQRPPAVCAIKQGGEALYRKARRGEHVDPMPRRVELHALELIHYAAPFVVFRVRCGSGFYVRSLARDVAERLGTVGHLVQLRRTAVSPFSVESALSVGLMRRAAAGQNEARLRLRQALLPATTACCWLPRLWLTATGLADARHGRRVSLNAVIGDVPFGRGPAMLLDAAAQLVAIGRRDGDVFRVVRGFNLG
ncbi:MAG: tRNA pseudouridine(55) synthase TruB [Proteobacteria bacterium]|nr:tRNA pseudouridine(55) synthase TruB [Pseudomonadota bacterium]